MNGSGAIAMADMGRLTAAAVEAVDELEDVIESAIHDGVIDLRERLEIKGALRRAQTVSTDADEAVAMTVTMLRRGPDSPRLRRLQGERAQRLRLVEMGDPLTAA